MPDPLTGNALVSGLHRGVRVRIVVPGDKIDSASSRAASRARWGPLLGAGPLIAEFVPKVYRCRIMISDRRVAALTGAPDREGER